MLFTQSGKFSFYIEADVDVLTNQVIGVLDQEAKPEGDLFDVAIFVEPDPTEEHVVVDDFEERYILKDEYTNWLIKNSTRDDFTELSNPDDPSTCFYATTLSLQFFVSDDGEEYILI